MKIFNQLDHTHMPYIVDENTMLFCKAKGDNYIEEDGRTYPQPSLKMTPYRRYDLFTSDLNGNNVEHIDIGVGEKLVVCTPTCFTMKDGKVKITFALSMTGTGSLRSYHFEKIGNSLTTMPSKSQRAKNKWGLAIHSPSETERYIYTPFCNRANPYFFVQDKEYGIESKYRLSCTNLRRLVPIANDDKNVIMLSLHDGNYISSLVNLETLLVRDIKVNGKDVYKCSILDDVIIHTVRGKGKNYSRQLHKDSYDLVPSTIKVWLDK